MANLSCGFCSITKDLFAIENCEGIGVTMCFGCWEFLEECMALYHGCEMNATAITRKGKPVEMVEAVREAGRIVKRARRMADV